VSHRFLPWVRRGLAAEIVEPDDLAGGLPGRASFPVRLKTTGGDASARLRLYGPGDVVGLDTRSIVRIEPRRGTGDFAPNQFVSVEFDPPDLPWMFTPGRANTQDRLRPWLVLVVVEKQKGVGISVSRDRPLPQLTIEDPAKPAVELPDLAESWAWGHAQLVEDNGGGDVTARLQSEPDLNVSRLVCPRRLQPDRSYFACLVPAFDAGRKAGLGEEGPEPTTTTSAWGGGGGGATKVVLPVYYHWEFRTGPAGDFESLARRLTPMELPDGVGSRLIFIGDADRALPALPATVADGGIVRLEGALRSPEAGPEVELGSEHRAFLDALKKLLDAAAAHVDQGTPGSSVLPAENVAPPIYGSWHTRTHVVPAEGELPKWVRDLNIDPRHRAAASLGTEVVRANQERYMDAAWEQVGDVIDANQALNVARLIDLVTIRVLDRHIRPLDATGLFSLTSPMHAKTILGTTTLDRVIDRSVMPVGVSDPSFRRRMSPQNNVLKRAARFAPIATPVDGTVAIRVVRRLANDELAVDFDRPVDGLATSTLLDRLPPAQDGIISGDFLGLPGSVSRPDVADVIAARDDLASNPVGEIDVRPDIAITGVFVDRHLDRIAGAAGATRPAGAIARDVIALRRAEPDAVAFLLYPGGEEIDTLELAEEGLLRARNAAGVTRDVANLDPALAPALGRGGIGGVIGRLPEGMFDPEGRGPMITDVRLDLGPGEGVEPFTPTRGGPLTTTLDPPVKDSRVVGDFANAYQRYTTASKVSATSLIPAPLNVDLPAVRVHLVDAVNPGGTIRARAGIRIKVGSSPLLDLIAPDRLRHDEDLGPIMVGPILPEPLYRDLARLDQDRFLPGAGLIPANSITLLETNPRFIEAFLVGSNHEMNRELLWRSYPTDRRGTPFRLFWDRVDGMTDIGPIHEFFRNRRLGKNNVGPAEGAIVLLVRGDLLRRYPNSIVYGTPSRADRKLDQNPAVVELPVFGGKLDPDITFVGFNLTVEQISPEPGWFFVIQEQPTEPRFGLDEPNGPTPTLTNWSNLSWVHVNVAGGGHLPLSALSSSLNLALAGLGSPRAKWRQDAAHMAAITFQRPFRVAVHSSDVLDAQNGST